MKTEKEKYDNWEHVIEYWHGEEDVDVKKHSDPQFQFAERLADIKPDVEVLKHVTSTNIAWQQLSSKMGSYQLLQLWFKYAAIVIVSLLVGASIVWLRPNEENLVYNYLEVPFGQTAKITLSDSTQVWLNSGTTLRYPGVFSKSERTVHVKGEAYFDVTENKQQPFYVKTKRMNVQVMGTSFNVTDFDNELNAELVLVEGQVNLLTASGKKVSELSPNERLVVSKKKIVKSNIDASKYNAWREGKLQFSGETLGEIAPKLERWYNVEIRFKDEELRKVVLSGTFLRYKPFGQVLEALSLLGHVKYKIEVNIDEKDIVTIYK
ncbi:DUF4974 domain-containing protein [Prolixibacteraceae bacterium JC049]|nr:DUF4974 domain-containing protein [Prolixibacteraceae bacterium JC049]